MKKSISLCLLTVLSFSFAFAKDPVEGYWKSMDGKKPSGYWRIYEKNGKLFGDCLLAINKPVDQTCVKCKRNYKNHPMMSEDFPKCLRAKVPLVYNLKKISKGVWEDGNIIDARNGNLYTCNISLQKADGKKHKEDKLAVRGEIGLGIGKTIYWEKASIDEINKAIIEHAEKYGGDYARANLNEFLINE
ncbi:MAG: DUF2147 domain-containing protein [Treponemataceae bacterium]